MIAWIHHYGITQDIIPKILLLSLSICRDHVSDHTPISIMLLALWLSAISVAITVTIVNTTTTTTQLSLSLLPLKLLLLLLWHTTPYNILRWYTKPYLYHAVICHAMPCHAMQTMPCPAIAFHQVRTLSRLRSHISNSGFIQKTYALCKEFDDDPDIQIRKRNKLAWEMIQKIHV